MNNNTPAPATPNHSADAYDVRVWSPIDTCLNGRRVQPSKTGTTGKDAPYPPAWHGDSGMVGMRLAPGVVAIDVDNYDGKTGADTLRQLSKDLGISLPPTLKVTARGADNPSGKFLYTVPEGWTGRDPGKDVELLRTGHRFVAMGIHCKTGNRVQIFDVLGRDIPLSAVTLERIPALPQPWLAHLAAPAGGERTGEGFSGDVLAVLGGGEVPPELADLLEDPGDGQRDKWIADGTERLADAVVRKVPEGTREAYESMALVDPEKTERLFRGALDKYLSGEWEVRGPVAQPAGDDGEDDELPGQGAPAGRLLEEWASQPDPAPPALLDCGLGPIVRPATLGSIHAPEKQGKTWTVIAWAVLEAGRGRRVLYVDYENGARRFARRIRAAAQVASYASPDSPQGQRMAHLQDRIDYMPDPYGQITDAELAAYDLIFIDAAIDLVDNHTDITHGGDTVNSAQAVNRVYRRLSRIARETGACVVLVDHSNEQGNTSGSRRKRGALDWLAKAEKIGDYTYIQWEFDRDSEDDKLPAVWLLFDGYRLSPRAPQPKTAPSLTEWAEVNRQTEEQVARYRRIMMDVGRDPEQKRHHYRAEYGHQRRDIDALRAMSVLALTGDENVTVHPECPREWRWWWDSALTDSDN